MVLNNYIYFHYRKNKTNTMLAIRIPIILILSSFYACISIAQTSYTNLTDPKENESTNITYHDINNSIFLITGYESNLNPDYKIIESKDSVVNRKLSFGPTVGYSLLRSKFSENSSVDYMRKLAFLGQSTSKEYNVGLFCELQVAEKSSIVLEASLRSISMQDNLELDDHFFYDTIQYVYNYKARSINYGAKFQYYIKNRKNINNAFILNIGVLFSSNISVNENEFMGTFIRNPNLITEGGGVMIPDDGLAKNIISARASIGYQIKHLQFLISADFGSGGITSNLSEKHTRISFNVNYKI